MLLRIKEIAERQGITLADIARETHLNYNTIHRIANGKGNPRLSTLARVAAVLGVRVMELLEDTGVQWVMGREPTEREIDQAAEFWVWDGVYRRRAQRIGGQWVSLGVTLSDPVAGVLAFHPIYRPEPPEME